MESSAERRETIVPSPTAETRSPPVTIRGVSKRYGNTVALDTIDLDVASGEFITLLGASGSGKTTLLMILAGFVRPDSGSVLVGDEEMITTPPHRRNVGMVFQNYALFPHMNVFENIAFPLRQRRAPRDRIAERVEWALDLVQLGGLARRRVDQLSGGQKQRVALARAIVFEPRILLMDEPLSALDKQLREKMQIEIRHLHERLGMTTIYVTHDQREALTLSDRVAVIAQGRVSQVDQPRRLYERPRSRYVAEFIGESSFLPVEVTDSLARACTGPLVLAEPLASSASRQWLVLRPEKLWLLDDARDTTSLNIFEGRVTDIVYQGESLVCYVALEGGHTLAMRSYSRVEAVTRMPAVGQPIRLGLNPEDTIIVPEDQ